MMMNSQYYSSSASFKMAPHLPVLWQYYFVIASAHTLAHFE